MSNSENRGCGEWSSNAMNTARFLAFFSANIRNASTRLAYTRVAHDFFCWIKARGLTLEEIQPLHVEAYLDGLSGATRSVNQKLAAIRMLFEWLVTGGIVSTNPAAVVRGAGHVVKVGKTSVLTTQELDSIPLDLLVGSCGRRQIGVMYEQRRLKIWEEFWGERCT